MMCRCPVGNAARIKLLADEANVTISNFVADMVNERVKGVPLTEKAKEWIAAHREKPCYYAKIPVQTSGAFLMK